jgi:hypothetical protein
VGVGQTLVWGIAVAQIRRTVFARPKQTQRLSAKVWGIELRRIYGAAGRVILPRMTRHKTAQTGLGTPQPRQLWLTAVLRAFAMLVLNVASTLQMIRRRDAVIGTQPTPAVLPRASTDTQSQETPPAAQHRSPIALMVSSTQSVRPSNHEGVLTTPSVSHAPRAIHLPQFSTGGGKRRTVATKGSLPPPVRSTGGGGSPRLRGETEGVRRDPRSGRIGPVDQFEQRTPGAIAKGHAKPTVTSGSVHSMHAFPAKAGIQPQHKSAQSAQPLDPRLRGGGVFCKHANKNAAA